MVGDIEDDETKTCPGKASLLGTLPEHFFVHVVLDIVNHLVGVIAHRAIRTGLLAVLLFVCTITSHFGLPTRDKRLYLRPGAVILDRRLLRFAKFRQNRIKYQKIIKYIEKCLPDYKTDGRKLNKWKKCVGSRECSHGSRSTPKDAEVFCNITHVSSF